MVNLGICGRCKKRVRTARGLVDSEDRKLSATYVLCSAFEPNPRAVEWDSEIPEDCPYRLEHMMSSEAIEDLAEEARYLREGKAFDETRLSVA